MQFLKKIILSTTSVFTLSTALFLSSCAPKNSCDTLVCKNGGTCAADFCNCPTGFDGPECQNKITDRYIGTYSGFTDPRNGQPTHIDTVDVYTSSDPLTLSVVRRRRYDLIYSGIIENKTNSILISDIISGNRRSIINVTVKAPTSVSTKRTLNMNVEEYESGVKKEELTFNGQLIAQ
ncbi:MAG: hypothetical protein V4561_06810 [Bacteroidota bacterium]